MFSYSTDTIVESGVKHKIGYDVQSIIPSYCCTIRHINSFRHKDQEISPPNI
jgi:hypothetical protein